jgi:hypothetical protein
MHRNRGRTIEFSEEFGMHSKAATQVFTCTEIEATAGTNFWVDFRTVRTVLAQNSRAVQFSFWALFSR